MSIGYMTDALVRSYDNLGEGDWDDTVADGGITFGMVWSKEARDTLDRILPRICTECDGEGYVLRGDDECHCTNCNGIGFVPKPVRTVSAPVVFEREDGMPF